MLSVDRFSRTPIYEQIIVEVEKLITEGELVENSLLPSVRALSQELSINPNTLQKAYLELERRGLCYAVPGSGRFITKSAKSIVVDQKRKLLSEIAHMCAELKRCGVPKADVIKAVDAAYENSGGDVK